MWREINGRRKDAVDYFAYLDGLAIDIGCKPNICELV